MKKIKNLRKQKKMASKSKLRGKTEGPECFCHPQCPSECDMQCDAECVIQNQFGNVNDLTNPAKQLNVLKMNKTRKK